MDSDCETDLEGNAHYLSDESTIPSTKRVVDLPIYDSSPQLKAVQRLGFIAAGFSHARILHKFQRRRQELEALLIELMSREAELGLARTDNMVSVRRSSSLCDSISALQSLDRLINGHALLVGMYTTAYHWRKELDSTPLDARTESSIPKLIKQWKSLETKLENYTSVGKQSRFNEDSSLLRKNFSYEQVLGVVRETLSKLRNILVLLRFQSLETIGQPSRQFLRCVGLRHTYSVVATQLKIHLPRTKHLVGRVNQPLVK